MLQVLAIILQLQCGTQQVGSVTLAYGSTVYLEQNSSIPKVAFFKDYFPEFQEHPLCAELKSAMETHQSVELHLNAHGEVQ